MPTDDSAAERNKKIIRRVFDEFVNKGVFSVVDEIYREDMIDHQPLPGAPEGRPGVKYTIAGLRAGFPDLHVTIEDMSAHADHVVIHNTWRGTHLGDFLGMAPTGRRMESRGVVVWRLVDGLIAERWGIGVESDMLAQLGMRRLYRGGRAGRPGANAGPAAAPAVNILTVPPGRAERWRELQAELAGPRLAEYEASRRRAGIVRESFWLQQDNAECVVHYVEARNPATAGRRLSGSEEPFDVWLRGAAREIYGTDPWALLAEGGTAGAGHAWTLPVELVPADTGV
ncbi:ester cyclase [Streptomyces griseorubiginosus]|uniref:ester cyclase n=1 Tax=Streptomyces griseorubiginosus TaxID=67304 RepID=UPI001AD6E143|nr:ester cyclase [Streptomyces griseorubiginosus]MBO4254036.1 ester cyclase [Streptomyces griseorubiginosus]